MDTVKRLIAKTKKDPVIFYGFCFCFTIYLVANPIMDYFKNRKFEAEAKQIYEKRMRERVQWRED